MTCFFNDVWVNVEGDGPADANALEETPADRGRLRLELVEQSPALVASANLTPAERRVSGLPNTVAWLAEDVDTALTDQMMAEQLTRPAAGAEDAQRAARTDARQASLTES